MPPKNGTGWIWGVIGTVIAGLVLAGVLSTFTRLGHAETGIAVNKSNIEHLDDRLDEILTEIRSLKQ